MNRNVAQLGSAFAWGARGRRFKSGHSDFSKICYEEIYKMTLTNTKNGLSLIGGLAIAYVMLTLVLPMSALFWRAGQDGWSTFIQAATDSVALSAYEVTFITALLAALLNMVFGLLVAWVLVRYRFPGRRLLDAAVDLPFALPTSVAGITLATVYGDSSWLGTWLMQTFGVQVAFTRIGVALAMIFVSFPFVVRTVQPVLRSLEPELEEAAQVLGATPLQCFRYVIFPALLPSLLTGTALGFSRAVGEFGSVVIVASNVPFKDLVAPVLIFQELERYSYSSATALGSIMLLTSLLLLFILNFIQTKTLRRNQ